MILPLFPDMGITPLPSPSQKAVLTAMVGRNRHLFPDILRLYVDDGACVLDATWGQGNFWLGIHADRYRITRNDFDSSIEADTHHDVRRLAEFWGEEFDVVVIDPPYAGYSSPAPIKDSISSPYNLHATAPASHDDLLSLYRKGAEQARRVLVVGGHLILKCQDQIENHRQHWTHAELLDLDGFRCEDLFVMVQETIPAMRHLSQQHARKNHSYFLVHKRVR